MAPVILVAAAGQVGADVVDALERRYGADYEVVALGEPVDTFDFADRQVALALAPMDGDGAAALQVVRERSSGARCVAIVTVGDTSVAGELSRSLTLNAVDYYVGHPWATPEEELYPVTGEGLRVWSRDQRLSFPKLTIVDAPEGQRGQALASWLDRNAVASAWCTTDSPAGRALVDGPLAGVDLPAVQLYNGVVLGNPTEHALAEALGARTRSTDERYDVAIVGAGPAGLAAAVYAAAEGLRTVVLEQHAVGGQAGTSAKIRNYLGFRWGISGADLAIEASRQAEQLGAEFLVTRGANGLEADADDHLIRLENGDAVRARTVVLAGGVRYRELGVASVDRLIGRGVFYGAGSSEVSALAGRRACVVGAGNSAGQAACALAAVGAAVTVLVRRESLADTMSDYLIQQLTNTAGVHIRTGAEVAEAIGGHQLEGLVVRVGEVVETIEVEGLFVFIGAQPHTAWLEGTVALDSNRFVVTGRDLPDPAGAAWLETSRPGVFAAGDIRFGSIKRVAAAVGEGSTASMLARDHLNTVVRP